jgi:hypothetical protein
MALDTLVAEVVVSKVAVSSVLTAAPTATPLMTQIIATQCCWRWSDTGMK